VEPELHLLGRHEPLVPDVAGWRVERMPALPDTAFFEVSPDWVAEILSPRTAAIDRADKMPIYAAAGVGHAWLVIRMRGPLLSGPLGSAATLERVALVLRARGPVVVLSALWLAEALSASFPVAALIEADVRRPARRVVRRAGTKRRPLLVAAGGAELPLRSASLGALVVENLAEIEDDFEAADFLAELPLFLRSDGLVLSLDATRSAAAEERIAGLFMAAGLIGVTQERPRDGVVLTAAGPAAAVVVAARVGSSGAGRPWSPASRA